MRISHRCVQSEQRLRGKILVNRNRGRKGRTEVRAKLGSALAATVAIDEDLTAKTLLALHTSVGYAHPCRCIGVNAYAAQRLARGGVDVWVSIDLAPR